MPLYDLNNELVLIFNRFNNSVVKINGHYLNTKLTNLFFHQQSESLTTNKNPNKIIINNNNNKYIQNFISKAKLDKLFEVENFLQVYETHRLLF